MSRQIARVIYICFLLFLILPLLLLVWLSLLPPELATVHLKNTDIKLRLSNLSLQQFQTLFHDRRFLLRYGNSVHISVLSLLLQLPIAVCTGFFLSLWKSKANRMITMIYVILMLLPFQTIMLPVYQLSLLFGIHNTHFAVILFNAFSPMGTIAILLLLRSIEKEQWEAALLETSSSVQLLHSIFLPQIRSGVVFVAVLLFIDTWNQVEQPLILLSDSRLMPLSLSLNDIYSVSSGNTFAGALLYSMPILLLAIFIALKEAASAAAGAAAFGERS